MSKGRTATEVLRRRLRQTEIKANRSTRRLARHVESEQLEQATEDELARSDQLAASVQRAVPWALGAVALGVGFVVWRRSRKVRR